MALSSTAVLLIGTISFLFVWIGWLYHKNAKAKVRLYLLLVFAGIVGLALYNQVSDAEILPEIAAYRATKQRPLPDQQRNAAFAIWGIRTSAQRDPQAEGIRYFHAAQQAFSQRTPIPDTHLSLPLPNIPRCFEHELNCFVWLDQQVKKGPWATADLLILKRYRQIRTYSDIASPQRGLVATYMPMAVLPDDIQRLWALDVFRTWNQDAGAGVLADIAADLSFWTKASINAGALYERQYVASFLERDYQLLAAMAESQPQKFIQYQADFIGLLKPLPSALFDLREPMREEFEQSLARAADVPINGIVTEQQIDDPGEKKTSWRQALFRWVNPLFYQENRTKNALYLRHKAVLELQKLPLAQLIQVDDNRFSEDEECHFSYLKVLRNPVGNSMLCSSPEFAISNVPRLYRVEALRRLVKLKLSLLADAHLREFIEKCAQERPSHFHAYYDLKIPKGYPIDPGLVAAAEPSPLDQELPLLDWERKTLRYDWIGREEQNDPVQVSFPKSIQP